MQFPTNIQGYGEMFRASHRDGDTMHCTFGRVVWLYSMQTECRCSKAGDLFSISFTEITACSINLTVDRLQIRTMIIYLFLKFNCNRYINKLVSTFGNSFIKHKA